MTASFSLHSQDAFPSQTYPIILSLTYSYFLNRIYNILKKLCFYKYLQFEKKKKNYFPFLDYLLQEVIEFAFFTGHMTVNSVNIE